MDLRIPGRTVFMATLTLQIKEGGIRKWQAGAFSLMSFNFGRMPPHPAYCRQWLFEAVGLYSPGYGTAADYDLMLRFLLEQLCFLKICRQEGRITQRTYGRCH
ncbi:hypothetical protein [Mucilaginibacter sp.]|uniref:hypothetical protein n=1 Tax=Mucilaginibacter sp. TaxID=1882438 RepID=UPI0026335DE1|nr:hypothetical protein [Mucilaginibacter sp.]